MISNHPWIAKIRKGDVLRSRSGLYRIVRAVTHSPIPFYGIRTSVTFAIRHCSWTRACYTTYTGNDLIQMGYMPVRARFALRAKLDRLIEADIGKPKSERKLTCCDVEGIA